MSNLRKLALIALVLFSFLACQKKESTTTGNPLVSLTVAASSQARTVAKNIYEKLLTFLVPSAQALPPPSAMEDSQGLIVTLSEAWLSIEGIEFEATETADSSETDGDEIELQGPYHVNLFASTPDSLGSARISLSAIRRIKMKLHRVEDDSQGAPADMLNNSIMIKGTVSGHAFKFITEEEVEFEIGGANALAVANGTDLLMSFQVANLIRLIDLSSITSDLEISSTNRVAATNPCPLIDASSNDLYTCFRKGIEQQANLGKDDGDGELESGEDSVKE